MHPLHADTRLVEIAVLGERLSALRLCDAAALATVCRSLEEHGQLSALTLFAEPGSLDIIDGFKRVRAARALGWGTLIARIDDVGSIDAKLRLRELHDRRGLTELEEAWVVRSLYREDGMSQPEIARRMSRHKSWVWRRLMLVEALDPSVQIDVRLGLIAPRAAVAVSGRQEYAFAFNFACERDPASTCYEARDTIEDCNQARGRYVGTANNLTECISRRSGR